MKQVLILGKGKSGQAAKNFLESQGYNCFVVDDKDYLEEAGPSSFCFGVLSPGFAPDNLLVKKCKTSRLRLVSELDLGLCALKTKNVVAVTGTNGKTTCVTLINKFLSTKQPSFALGNIGSPLCDKVQKITEQSAVILELSSFMLAQSKRVAPHIALLTNITPDHKEWHKTFSAYKNAKLKIFKKQTAGDYAILNADDKNYKNFSKGLKSNILSVSLTKKVKGCYKEGENIIFYNGHIHEIVAKTTDIKLFGQHNITNVLMCILAAKLLGVTNQNIKNTLKSFTGLPHRLEYVGKVNGVVYVNDSKSTNMDSCMVACSAFNSPITLLVGGYDKGIDITSMFEALLTKVKNIVAFGACGSGFYNQAKSAGFKSVYLAPNLNQAVSIAQNIAKKGEVVLLSPATSSFDQFKDYKARGEAFMQLVNELAKNRAKIKTD